MELETFRDIVCQQIDTLQSYFDACAGAGGNLKQTPHVDSHDPDIFGSNDGCKSTYFVCTIMLALPCNPQVTFFFP